MGKKSQVAEVGPAQQAAKALADSLNYKWADSGVHGRPILISPDGITLSYCGNWYEAYHLILGVSLGLAARVK